MYNLNFVLLIFLSIVNRSVKSTAVYLSLQILINHWLLVLYYLLLYCQR